MNNNEQIKIDHEEIKRRFAVLSMDSLRYIRSDAQEAIKANPEGPKAGYYQDEINYASMEIAKRLRITEYVVHFTYMWGEEWETYFAASEEECKDEADRSIYRELVKGTDKCIQMGKICAELFTKVY